VIPVDQDRFGFPGDTELGNCFTACVASLLEMPLADVPLFVAEDEWWDYFKRWLRERGWYPLMFETKPDASDAPEGLYIAGGQSPRRPDDPCALHAVIARGAKVVHDPHPSREGLLTRQDAIVLVPLDPCRLTRETSEPYTGTVWPSPS
jgi:hypothetical protein